MKQEIEEENILSLYSWIISVCYYQPMNDMADQPEESLFLFLFVCVINQHSAQTAIDTWCFDAFILFVSVHLLKF